MSLSSNLYTMMQSVMKKSGVAAKLIVDGDSVYDPETATDNIVTTEYDVRVIVMDFALISNGSLVQQGTLNVTADKQVYLDDTQADGSHLPFTIAPNGMRLRVGGITYRITVVKEYNPSTTERIMYDLKVEL